VFLYESWHGISIVYFTTTNNNDNNKQITYGPTQPPILSGTGNEYRPKDDNAVWL